MVTVQLVQEIKHLTVRAVKRITNLADLHQTIVYVLTAYIQKEVLTIVDHVHHHVQPVHLRALIAVHLAMKELISPLMENVSVMKVLS